MIDRGHDLPIAQQAKALGISRGSVYYLPRPVPAADLAVMRRMADPATSLFAITERYSLDLAGAVRSHAWAQQTVSNADATEYLKRTAVCTAILLARPEKRGTMICRNPRSAPV